MYIVVIILGSVVLGLAWYSYDLFKQAYYLKDANKTWKEVVANKEAALDIARTRINSATRVLEGRG